MTEEQALLYLKETKKHGIVPGLDNMNSICSTLNHPETKYSIIHITGTNGKGSTGAYIESILIRAGYKTGRFSSPAVIDFHECITVNGKFISSESYGACIGAVKNAADSDGVSPTAFEVEAAAAFEYFARSKCDIAIIEVGMGGRLDATNICSNTDVCVFTPVSKDHSTFLGNTLVEIASEKSGILKKGCVAISALQPHDVYSVLSDECKKKNIPLILADKTDILYSDINKTIFNCGNAKNLTIHMPGIHQPDNAALAVKACTELIKKGYIITNEHIQTGLISAYCAGRFEVLCKSPSVIIADGAHNPAAAALLAENIKLYFSTKRIAYIIGVFRDKEYSEIAKLTAELAEKIFCVTPPTDRGLPSTELASEIQKYNKNTEAVPLNEALSKATSGGYDAVICFGTLSTIKEIKEVLQENI